MEQLTSSLQRTLLKALQRTEHCSFRDRLLIQADRTGKFSAPSYWHQVTLTVPGQKPKPCFSMVFPLTVPKSSTQCFPTPTSAGGYMEILSGQWPGSKGVGDHKSDVQKRNYGSSLSPYFKYIIGKSHSQCT